MGTPAAVGVSALGLPNNNDFATAWLAGTITAVGPQDAFAFRGPMNMALYAYVTNRAFTTTNGSLSATVSSATLLAAGNAINSANVPPGTTIGALSGTTITLALPAVSLHPVLGSLSTSSQLVQMQPGSNVNALLGATVTAPNNAATGQIVIPANTTVLSIVQQDIPANTANNYPGQVGVIQLSAAPTQVPPTTGKGTHKLRFQLGAAAVTTGADAAAIFTGASVTYSAAIQLEKSFDGGLTWIIGSLSNGGSLAQWPTGTPVLITFGEPERDVLYRLNATAYTSGTIAYRFSQTGGANESLAIGPLVNG